jgi:LmbE family N-acetylglucosaminyl deacetylase
MPGTTRSASMPPRAEEAAGPGWPSVCVISPHLDDAVLSASVLLSNARIPVREVVTVVTHGKPGRTTDWARLTGFADAGSEHEARRKEDERALSALGVRVTHLGGVAEDPESIRTAIRGFLSSRAGHMDGTLLLLPAAAGRQHSALEALRRRLMRDPDAFAPHPEHMQVRDAFEHGLRVAGHGAWGYYAELPYARQESPDSLLRRLEVRSRHALRMLRHEPVSRDKLRAAETYASQARLALGETPAARHAFCGEIERLFIPVTGTG